MEYAPMPGLPPVKVPAMSCCLGLEPTPEAFVGHIVMVYRAVWRVLRDDGTAWVNFGDSYAASAKGSGGTAKSGLNAKKDANGALHGESKVLGQHMDVSRFDLRASGLKPKDLCGIPWRVAFALQADGWYLRSDVIWAKPNPMPESVTDRCTKAHEYIFQLAKRERYYYDVEAVKEEASQPHGEPMLTGQRKAAILGHTDSTSKLGTNNGEPTRNPRSVWHISTQSYAEAHFATFPEAIPERCIKAGTSERGCCPECGAPWVRVTTKDRRATRPGTGSKVTGDTMTDGNRDPERHVTETRTVGWRQGCDCPEHAPVPCTVLDQFNGSGTTGAVACQLGRHYIGCELNPAYIALAERRIGMATKPLTYRDLTRAADAPLFQT